MISNKTKNQNVNSSLKVIKTLSIAITAIGILVVGGWIFDIDVIKAPLNHIPMPFVAAISFILIGFSLYLLSQFYEGKRSVGIIAIPICLLVVFIFMAVSLVSLFLNVHAGIETAIENTVLKKESIINATTPSARPPVLASIVFILVASAQTSVIAGYSRSNQLFKIFGTIVMVIASSATIGHIINQPVLFYHISWSNGIPIHGSIGMEIMGISLVLLGRLDYKRNIRIETATIKTRLIFLFIGFMTITILIFSLWSYYIAITPRSLQDVTHIIIIMTSVILSIVTIYAVIIARSISSGITKLKNVSEELRKGRFDAKADANSNDEIGDLGRSFNDMVENIKNNEEKLRAQARFLEETARDKDQFAAMMSHEIKTPIVPIAGYAELLLDGTLGTITSIQREKIQIIYENSLRMAILVQDIVDAYRIGLGKLKLDVKEIRCNEIVSQCIESFRPPAEKLGIRLDNKSKDILIICDPNRIQQVLSNLVSNSLKYVSPSQGLITISTKLDDSHVVFTVEDNGVGIPKDKQSNLFHPFYQADTSLTRKPGGTGLGLSISKGIVELHGGEIWLESDEGKGTAVYFTIPTI